MTESHLDCPPCAYVRWLEKLGLDNDLAEESAPLHDDWAGWQLMRELCGLRKIGPTTASKLVAVEQLSTASLMSPLVAR
ncbi:hypothetical protein [Williamsia sp. 1135]|uniref:hypothetical protein n=1 Tax=Williamsia sp. 1135 TaxID=1889262 RepID=UPI001181385F|nr:hypothetical protein [Williamsia sp. 1135]